MDVSGHLVLIYKGWKVGDKSNIFERVGIIWNPQCFFLILTMNQLFDYSLKLHIIIKEIDEE